MEDGFLLLLLGTGATQDVLHGLDIRSLQVCQGLDLKGWPSVGLELLTTPLLVVLETMWICGGGLWEGDPLESQQALRQICISCPLPPPSSQGESSSSILLVPFSFSLPLLIIYLCFFTFK